VESLITPRKHQKALIGGKKVDTHVVVVSIRCAGKRRSRSKEKRSTKMGRFPQGAEVGGKGKAGPFETEFQAAMT